MHFDRFASGTSMYKLTVSIYYGPRPATDSCENFAFPRERGYVRAFTHAVLLLRSFRMECEKGPSRIDYYFGLQYTNLRVRRNNYLYLFCNKLLFAPNPVMKRVEKVSNFDVTNMRFPKKKTHKIYEKSMVIFKHRLETRHKTGLTKTLCHYYFKPIQTSTTNHYHFFSDR